MNDGKLEPFLSQYISMWHEPDALARRAIVAALFARDAENYTARSVARGLDEIAARVTRAHDEWVVAKGQVFAPTGNAATHHHLVKFFWKMLPRAGGPVVSIGLDIFVLNDEDRIQSLYQFIEPNS